MDTLLTVSSYTPRGYTFFIEQSFLLSSKEIKYILSVVIRYTLYLQQVYDIMARTLGMLGQYGLIYVYLLVSSIVSQPEAMEIKG